MTRLGHALFLGWAWLRSGPVRTAVLVAGTTLALLLPVFTLVATDVVEHRLLERARSSPVLIGHVGDEFDLTMAALYFRGQVRDPVPFGEVGRVSGRGYGLAVPLHVRHTVDGVPLVGTSLEYFEARGLRPAQGRLPALLGEVVVGAEAARAARLGPGDTVRNDSTNLYNLAGSYPAVLQVVGVLGPTGTPDDDALFTSAQTAWMLDGSIHGHAEVTREQALNPDAAEDENLEATAAIFMFPEVSDKTRATFHLHGDASTQPVTAVLVFPPDGRAHDQLLGDYALESTVQAVLPEAVIRTILGIVLQVRDALTATFAVVAVAMAAFIALVFSLSLRLRTAELELMRRMGCSRRRIALIVGAELAVVLLVAVALTGVCTWAGLSWLRVTFAT